MPTPDQQEHIKNLFKQANDLNTEISNLQATLASKRDLFLKVTGAIEYLQQIGVSLPSDSEETEETEAAE